MHGSVDTYTIGYSDGWQSLLNNPRSPQRIRAHLRIMAQLATRYDNEPGLERQFGMMDAFADALIAQDQAPDGWNTLENLR